MAVRSSVMATISDVLRSRIGRTSFLEKVKKAEDLIEYFPNGTAMGWSGFTGVGHPKIVPAALADHVEKNNLQGKLRYDLYVGASTSPDIEVKWAELDMIARRSCAVNGKPLCKAVNTGQVEFFDRHVSMFPLELRYGSYTLHKPNGKLDIALIEASAITEDGQLVLGPAVGATPEIIEMSEKVIIEINTTGPSFEGIHDITCADLPPNKKPLLVMKPKDRIGTLHVPIDPEKIIAIVESDHADNVAPNKPEDEVSKAIAHHMIQFFKREVKAKRMPPELFPLQSGLGNIANAVIGGLAADKDDFHHMTVWTEVLQDTFLDLFDSGSLDFASTCAIRFTPEGFKRLFDRWDFYKTKIVLRSQEIANHPEIIRRLGIVAMDTPVEVDLYGHANSSCVMGSRMILGLGGSNDFLRNGKYGIMHTPSVRPTKTDPTGISCIVPMVTHVDSTEHDLDIVITEQGIADLRGLSARERARAIIANCSHPDYKPILTAYLDKAEKECFAKGIGHEPHLLFQAYDMYKNLQAKGTMKIEKW